MKKSLKQQFKEFWTVTPHQCNPEYFRWSDGKIHYQQLAESQERMNKLAREEQFRNRLLIIGAVLAIPFIICVYLLIFKVILCIGLLLGCIIMLLN